MTRKAALVVLTLASPLALGAMLWNDPRAAWLLAAAVVALPTAMMTLGAGNRRAAVWISATGAVLLAGLGVLLAAAGAESPTAGAVTVGLVILGVLWLVPLLLVSAGFAVTFGRPKEEGAPGAGGNDKRKGTGPS